MKLALVGDIGGTNARFALADTSSEAPLIVDSVEGFSVADFPSLADAAKFGTKLIVGLNDDSSVHKLKGNDRPFNKLSSRAFVLASLQAVDLVIPFSELNPENLIRAIIPDVLAKGSDYTLENIAGAAFVLENKGEVVRIPLLPDISSTKMADFILKN